MVLAALFFIPAMVKINSILPRTRQFSVYEMDTIVTVNTRAAKAEKLESSLKIRIGMTARAIDRFDPESTVGQANAMPRKSVRLHQFGSLDASADEAKWYDTIKQLQADSGGALDCTLGQLSNLWNFGGNAPKVPDKAEIQKLLNAKRGFEVNLPTQTDGNDYGSIFVEDGGTLDLGAVGKGITCDVLAQYLRGWTAYHKVARAVISVGGSILLYGGGAFNVGIRTPNATAADTFATLTMPAGFVSTSGSYERYFDLDGVRYHHILDPKTGYPVQNGLVSVTVIADSGLLSDALSTACFVLGYERSKPLLEKYNAKAVFANEQHVWVYPQNLPYPSRVSADLGGGVTLELTDLRYSLAED
ncbi:MAG: FAD:protein FMN transferase [Oscillospiraceae bacterium]|nr:FAD:protein FMN transferase [Oscillospiraceae bacterium]